MECHAGQWHATLCNPMECHAAQQRTMYAMQLSAFNCDRMQCGAKYNAMHWSATQCNTVG